MSATPVSVIIPCYNAARFLSAAVESVLAQGLIGTEVLIIDDCSTDDSVAVAESLAAKHPLVRAIRQPVNAGPAAARNRGLRFATGQFVCFLDADDTYAPQFFRSVLPVFQTRPELAAISTGIELIGCQREVHPLQLQVVTNSLPSNLLVRRSVADFMGGFPEDAAFRGKAAGEDAAFRQALLRYFKIDRYQEPFLRYLVKPGSHFYAYLDRSEVRDGRMRILHHTEEERSGLLKKAVLAYFGRTEAKIAALKSVRTEPV
jgi:glycosyltransferase involved in cell wall biosynthesis